MKRLSLATAIAVLSMTGSAQAANSDSATVALTATVASTCYIADANFTPGSLDFGSQIDGTTAVLTEAGINATVGGYCNDATTTLGLASTNGGLHDSSTPTIAAGTFAGVTDGVTGRFLHYTTAASTWAGVAFDTEMATATSTAGALATTAINGTIDITVTLDDQGTNPVLAGIYTDTITVTISTGP